MRTRNYMRVKRFKGKPEYTQGIVDYVSSFSYEDLPGEVVQAHKGVILNLLGCALAGSKYEHSKILVKYIQAQGGNEDASVLGNTFKTSMVNAALVNGSMPYILDLDGHGADIGIWSGLAVGEKIGASGKDFITATIVGSDVHRRLVNAMRLTSMYNRRFHHAGICGCFNGTVTAGKLLGLDKGKFINALGLAGMLASSLMAWLTDPTEMSRALSPGLGARNGTTAALLADAGYAGPPTIFEGDWNAFDAFSGDYDRHELTKGLGKVVGSDTWFISKFKRHACCGDHHEALDALLKMMEEREIGAETIQEITVRLPPRRVPIVDNVSNRSHSIQYTLAVAAFDGEITPENILQQDRLQDPRVLQLSKRISVVGDPELGTEDSAIFKDTRARPTVIEVVTKDGRRIVERLDHTLSSLSSKAELEQKFMTLATTAVSAHQAKEIIKQVDDLDKLTDIRKLGDLLRLH